MTPTDKLSSNSTPNPKKEEHKYQLQQSHKPAKAQPELPPAHLVLGHKVSPTDTTVAKRTISKSNLENFISKTVPPLKKTPLPEEVTYQNIEAKRVEIARKDLNSNELQQKLKRAELNLKKFSKQLNW